jgi:hypothetical protein
MTNAVETEKHQGFTVYLEGDEGHHGNVLAHTFTSRIHKLILVFNKLERVHQDTGTKKTDFEIVAADKRNPTTLTLKPVPRVQKYSPVQAMNWGLDQLETIDRGDEPDERLTSSLLRDIAEMAAESKDGGHRTFWINGHTDAIHFNEDFHIKALTVARKRAFEEAPTIWHSGKSVGEVIGVLRRIDDLDVENEVVIVPKTGAEMIRCTFPDSMRDEIGKFWARTVRVTGVLSYEDYSPHPQRVKVREGGVEAYPKTQPAASFRDLRGLFAGKPRVDVEWDSLLNV